MSGAATAIRADRLRKRPLKKPMGLRRPVFRQCFTGRERCSAVDIADAVYVLRLMCIESGDRQPRRLCQLEGSQVYTRPRWRTRLLGRLETLGTQLTARLDGRYPARRRLFQ